MKHSIQTVACFTTFAISTGAQNFLETTKSEKFSERTNYSSIPAKPTKSDTKRTSCSPEQTTKLENYEILNFVNFQQMVYLLTNEIIWDEKTTTITNKTNKQRL